MRIEAEGSVEVRDGLGDEGCRMGGIGDSIEVGLAGAGIGHFGEM